MLTTQLRLVPSSEVTERDLEMLRRSFALARRARERGDGPFGAVLASEGGTILAEAANATFSMQDPWARAEVSLIRAIPKKVSRSQLGRATLYASSEPCAMGAGAIQWSGIGRIVYSVPSVRAMMLVGMPSHEISSYEISSHGIPSYGIPAHGRATTVRPFSCRAFFALSENPPRILGPILEEEGAALLV